MPQHLPLKRLNTMAPSSVLARWTEDLSKNEKPSLHSCPLFEKPQNYGRSFHGPANGRCLGCLSLWKAGLMDEHMLSASQKERLPITHLSSREMRKQSWNVRFHDDFRLLNVRPSSIVFYIPVQQSCFLQVNITYIYHLLGRFGLDHL